MRNLSAAITVFARSNWWGHRSGPLHPTTNPDGQGNAVSDWVDYEGETGASVVNPVPAMVLDPETVSFGPSPVGQSTAPTQLTIENLGTAALEIGTIVLAGSQPGDFVIANNTAMMIDPILATLPPLRAGTLRGMAITATARNAAAPALATAAEQGFPSLDIQSWWGLWGPRGTPAEVIARIGQVLSTGMFDADIAPRVNNMGVEPAAEPAAEFARFIQADFARSEALLRMANFQPE